MLVALQEGLTARRIVGAPGSSPTKYAELRRAWLATSGPPGTLVRVKVRPRPGVTLDAALTVLREAHTAYFNVRGAGHQGIDLYNAYLRTSTTQTTMLESALRSPDVDRLVTTPGHIRLTMMDQSAKMPVLPSLVHAEVDARIRALEEATSSLAKEAEFFGRPDLVVVADANTLLHHPRSVANIPWRDLAPADAKRVLVAIPILVIDELDKAKRQRSVKVAYGDETVSQRAQRTIRTLEGWFTEFDEGYSSHVLADTSPILEIAVVLDDADHERLPDADAEIIENARGMSLLTRGRLVLAAFDLGMRLRARAAGVAAAPPPGLPVEQ